MASELQAERAEMEQWISDNTVAATATLFEMKGNVLSAGGQAMDELRETVIKLGEGKAQSDEVSNLKAFIYDLAAIRFNPNVNGQAHGDGVQPYGKWVAKRIEQDIGVYGVETLKTFDIVTQEAVRLARVTMEGEEAALAVDN